MALADAVVELEDGHAFQCPRTDGSCAPFTSRGWPTKASALARLKEHMDEHAEGDAATAEGREVDRTKLMSPMHEFLAKHGLTTDANGKAVKA